ncbi:hypothetical protein [Terriglobus tenax]|uniref:hypothetical protein n=1 Tax=Terriglobus tenax TaxID=1111115 RepID=UPI0021E05961|nr:hypothetical protein [Terriglobus tenax]
MKVSRCCLFVLGLFFLLTVSFPARAQHYTQPALILKPDHPENFKPAFANAVATEIQQRWQELSPGHPSPLFYLSQMPSAASDFPEILFVRFTGSCDILPQLPPPHAPRPLGSVPFVNGEPINYILIDCQEIAQTINDAIAPMKPAERMDAMARAISRVFQHEYLHIHRHTAHHDETGVFASALSRRFLVAPDPPVAPTAMLSTAVIETAGAL